jgi:hypothetical protein
MSSTLSVSHEGLLILARPPIFDGQYATGNFCSNFLPMKTIINNLNTAARLACVAMRTPAGERMMMYLP